MSALLFFFISVTSTSEIYTLSLHDALPIWLACEFMAHGWSMKHIHRLIVTSATYRQASRLLPELRERDDRSEEHTSEVQSRRDLVCRLLLEKKNVIGVDLDASLDLRFVF